VSLTYSQTFSFMTAPLTGPNVNVNVRRPTRDACRGRQQQSMPARHACMQDTSAMMSLRLYAALLQRWVLLTGRAG